MNDGVVQLLTAIEPYSPTRAAHRALALFLSGTLPRIAERETMPAHLTASVFVIDHAGRVLLVHHPSSPEGLELLWFEIEALNDRYIREPAEAARSHVGKWAIVDSNHGPPPYQSGALTD